MMQRITWLGLALAMGLPPLTSIGPAAEDQEAKEILQQAIRAAGGERALSTLKAPMMWMERGTYFGMGPEGVPYIGQYSSKWPNWYRQEIEKLFTSTISGSKAWESSADGAKELKGEQLKERMKQARAAWAERLFPLADQAYTLVRIDGIDVNGRPTVGIKAIHADGGEMRIYFDKKTSLIAKLEMMVLSPQHGPKPVLSESFYSDHKHFGGVKMPSKLKLYYDHKLLVEAETIDYKVRATLDPALFEAPK